MKHLLIELIILLTSTNFANAINYRFVTENETVTLFCDATFAIRSSWNGPDLNVYTSGNRINTNLNYTIYIRLTILVNEKSEQRHYNLQIKPFVKEDVGIYTCSYEGHNSQYRVETVDVRILDITILDADSTNALYGSENRTMNITCHISGGFLNESISLFKNNSLVTTGGPNSLTYSFVPQRADHLNTVTCRTNNNLIEVSESVRLYIYCSPAIKIAPGPVVYVKEGEELTLNCYVTCHDRDINISWTRLGIRQPHKEGSIEVNQIYRMEKTNKTHAGHYQCKAESRIGVEVAEIKVVFMYIFITFLKTKRELRCTPRGVPTNYRFCRWEHKTDFNDHVRYILDDGNGRITLPIHSEETDRHHDRGIYICQVSSGTEIITEQYNLNAEGKPHFVTGNKMTQYGIHGKMTKIKVNVVSFPKFTSIDVLETNSSIDIHNIDVQFGELTDTMYGKTVHVKGYILTIPVEIKPAEEFKYYTIIVNNLIGSRNYTVKLISTEPASNSDVIYGVILVIFIAIVVIAVVIYWRFDFLKRSLGCLKCQTLQAGVVNHELPNNAVQPINTGHNDLPIYSSIDRRANLTIGKCVSYSVRQNRKPNSIVSQKQKVGENVHTVFGDSNEDPVVDLNRQVTDIKDLNYIDVCFDKKTKGVRYSIRGIDNKTPYTDVDFSKSFSGLSSIDVDDSEDDFDDVEVVKKIRRRTRVH